MSRRHCNDDDYSNLDDVNNLCRITKCKILLLSIGESSIYEFSIYELLLKIMRSGLIFKIIVLRWGDF